MTEARATGFLVQFPHPGGEHNPRSDEMPWNTDQHRRKFLVTPGRYLDADRRAGEAELVFWGEWEPPSRVVARWPRHGRLPRSLHQPFWAEPTTKAFRQNTDPWIFGKRMIYSNCKQVLGQERRRTSMQGLTPASVICFGSTIDDEFCVDTVLVVASAEPWIPADVDCLDLDAAFKICTGRSVATRSSDAQASLTLYRGATVDEPVEGMFSFVPARLAHGEDPRFSRPPVHSKFINPANRQSTWGSKRPLSMDTVRRTWETLCDQVVDAGLLLGVGFQTPVRERGDTTVAVSTRQRR